MKQAIQYLKDNNITLSESELALLERYVTAFVEYNTHTNLSAIRELDPIWMKHIADSLVLLRFEALSGKNIDVGTGGGIPGIPLAIMRPEITMTLLDSVGKKVAACHSFVEALDLKNTNTVQGRAEQIATEKKHRHTYDVVIARATAYLPIMLAWSENLLAPTGKIILYKTPSDDERKDGEAVARELKLELVREHTYELEGQTRYILVYENHDKHGNAKKKTK